MDKLSSFRIYPLFGLHTKGIANAVNNETTKTSEIMYERENKQSKSYNKDDYGILVTRFLNPVITPESSLLQHLVINNPLAHH